MLAPWLRVRKSSESPRPVLVGVDATRVRSWSSSATLARGGWSRSGESDFTEIFGGFGPRGWVVAARERRGDGDAHSDLVDNAVFNCARNGKIVRGGAGHQFGVVDITVDGTVARSCGFPF